MKITGRSAMPTEFQGNDQVMNVLICLSASPSNQKVIQSAARYARGSNAVLTALFVDNGKRTKNDPYLRENMEIAKSLGASVEILTQEDVLGAIVDYAQEHSVTHLFIGYSGPSKGGTLLQHLPVYRLVNSLPDVDVHIIPGTAMSLRPSGLITKEQGLLNLNDFLKLAVIMICATGISALFDRSHFSNSNIITIYILAVLVTSVTTAGSIYGIIAAVLYILLFNYLFIEPRFTLLVYDPYYMVTYLVSVIAAIITGNLSTRMKRSMQQATINAYQAQILLNTSELLQRAASSSEITRIITMQLRELLGRDARYFHTDTGKEGLISDPAFADIRTRADEDAIEWTYSHGVKSGWGTKAYPEAGYQYLSVRSGNSDYGIIGIEGGKDSLSPFEENLLLSLIGECSLSLESERNRKEREAAQIIAENEQFRSKLLRSVSHDLRTPLTSISGNASTLQQHEEELEDSERKQIYSDIYEDAIWLIDLVENLLSITKLEEHVEMNITGEVVSDILTTAVNHARRHKSGHQILLECDEECLVARMDVNLILQVVNNLISNGVKHTPDHTTIRVWDKKMGHQVMIGVSDNGPGIPDDEKEKIFDLFYTGKQAGADSSKSLGLGLNLCKSIVEAHDGSIWVEDNNPAGSVFIFTLKLWEENGYG